MTRQVEGSLSYVCYRVIDLISVKGDSGTSLCNCVKQYAGAEEGICNAESRRQTTQKLDHMLSHIRRGEILTEGSPEVGGEEFLKGGPCKRRNIDSRTEREPGYQIHCGFVDVKGIGEHTESLKRIVAARAQIVMQGS